MNNGLINRHIFVTWNLWTIDNIEKNHCFQLTKRWSEHITAKRWLAMFRRKPFFVLRLNLLYTGVVAMETNNDTGTWAKD